MKKDINICKPLEFIQKVPRYNLYPSLVKSTDVSGTSLHSPQLKFLKPLLRATSQLQEPIRKSYTGHTGGIKLLLFSICNFFSVHTQVIIHWEERLYCYRSLHCHLIFHFEWVNSTTLNIPNVFADIFYVNCITGKDNIVFYVYTVQMATEFLHSYQIKYIYWNIVPNWDFHQLHFLLTNGWTYGWTNNVKPVYPPVNFIEAGGIIIDIALIQIMAKCLLICL